MENFKEKFQYYNGSESIQEAVELVEKLGQDKAKCYYIKFMNQYYAVFYSSMNNEIIIGQEKVFYMSNGHLHETDIYNYRAEYKVNSRVAKNVTDTLAVELMQIDSNIEFYYYPTVKSKEITTHKKDIGNIYLVLLGVTFANKFYSINNLREMEKYFVLSKELIYFLRKTKGAEKIDPFKQLILFEDQSVGKYGILSYPRNYGGYYSSTLGFALLSKNKYVEVKREWPSLTRYRAMYPDDYIDYPKPDFRADISTCKNCGKKLPEGRTEFCCNECNDEYTKDTSIERTTSMLCYKILCRDKFICQECGLDLARINRHGIRIPANNGGEVHHIDNVQNGGSDHQKNLKSLCHDCHQEQDHNKKNISQKKDSKVIELFMYRG